jgi:hypothetical protein
MLKSFGALISLSILVALAGCAGTDFVRPTQDAFKLGRTTYAEVTRQLGEPRREGTVLKNDKNLKSITYAFAATGGDPLEQGVIPARAMSYLFLDNTLVGQEFVSSFKEDHSNFDDTKVPVIVKGQTTRAEVTKLLGRASGSYLPPVVKATSGEAVGYTYFTTSGGAFSGFKFFRKALLVSFDERDVVSDVEYSTSGSK